MHSWTQSLAEGLAGSPSAVLLVLECQGQCLRRVQTEEELCECCGSSAWMDGQGCAWMDGSEHSVTALSIAKIKPDAVQSLQSRSEIPCSALVS